MTDSESVPKTIQCCDELKVQFEKGFDAVVKYYSSQVSAYLPDEIADLIGEYTLPDTTARIECKDHQGKWYVSTVLSINKTILKIHYINWAEKYNEELDINSGRIAEVGTFTDGKPYCRSPSSRAWSLIQRDTTAHANGLDEWFIPIQMLTSRFALNTPFSAALSATQLNPLNTPLSAASNTESEASNATN